MQDSRASNPEDHYNQYADDFQELGQSNLQKSHILKLEEAEDHEQHQVELKIDKSERPASEQAQVLDGSTGKSNQKVKRRDLRDGETENKIKETIDRLTQNILTSKKEIVQQISTINKYQQQNQKEIKLKDISRPRPFKHSIKKSAQQQQKQRIIENLKAKEEEKRRKKQIYLMQKMERKERQHIKKDRSRMKEKQLEERILYQQKFKTRKGLSPQQLQEKIDEGQIKLLEEVFIQRIKDRLNIGKKSIKQHQSLNVLPPRNERRKKAMERQVEMKKYNKKINQDNKFKQKILMNLKIKRGQDQEQVPIKGPQLSAAKTRNYYSAPNIRLPAINLRDSKRATLYERGERQEEKTILGAYS